MVCSFSAVVEGFWFPPLVTSSKVNVNNEVGKAPGRDKENNLVAEKSLSASAA